MPTAASTASTEAAVPTAAPAKAPPAKVRPLVPANQVTALTMACGWYVPPTAVVQNPGAQHATARFTNQRPNFNYPEPTHWIWVECTRCQAAMVSLHHIHQARSCIRCGHSWFESIFGGLWIYEPRQDQGHFDQDDHEDQGQVNQEGQDWWAAEDEGQTDHESDHDNEAFPSPNWPDWAVMDFLNALQEPENLDEPQNQQPMEQPTEEPTEEATEEPTDEPTESQDHAGEVHGQGTDPSLRMADTTRLGEPTGCCPTSSGGGPNGTSAGTVWADSTTGASNSTLGASNSTIAGSDSTIGASDSTIPDSSKSSMAAFSWTNGAPSGTMLAFSSTTAATDDTAKKIGEGKVQWFIDHWTQGDYARCHRLYQWFSTESQMAQYLAEHAMVVEEHGSLVVTTMATTFVERIRAAKNWTSAGIIQLIGEVQSMELPDAIKESIQEAVETCQTNEASHIKLSSCGQKIAHVPAYLTTADWQALESAVSKDDQMSVMAKRLRAMGLTSLKENTVHQVLATLLYVNHSRGQPQMQPSAIHSMVDDFQAIFHGTAKIEAVPKLATYSEDPLQNGEAWLSQAYTNGCSPANKKLPLHAWYRKVPMRKNHHLLVGYHVPAESNKAHGSHDHLAKAAQMLSQLAERWASPPAEPEIKLLQPRQDRLALQNLPTPQQQPSQLALLPVQNEQNQAAGSQAAVPPDPMLATAEPDMCTEKPCNSKPKTLQEFEDQHFEELRKRKLEAKEKAAKANQAKPVAKNQDHLPPHKRDPPIFGCPKCRGNPSGCGQCLSPTYTGLRLPGREAYRAHMARKARMAK
ncbi:unnamed protein product [Symbiodinium sp. CCMP2592]|nr:unnamed protein product [Symbiodinium sp. CCMP2592]